MTDRLRTLLHAEADRLDIPPAPAWDALAEGRRVRRRRRFTTGLAAAAVLAVAAAGTVGVAAIRDGTGTGRDAGTQLSAAAAAYLSGGAYAVGSTVHFGATGDHAVEVGGKVKAIYYTSAGVVVRAGGTPWTDDAGPSRFALVTPDGDVEPLGLELGDRAPDADPATPYFAYGDAAGAGQWRVVVHDVVADRQLAAVAVPGDFTWGGWQAPPVKLSGDTVYVGMDEATYAVDWRTGDVTPVDLLPRSQFPEVQGRTGFVADEASAALLDVTTGEELVSVATGKDVHAFARLSPDGRFAFLRVEHLFAGPAADQEVRVYDVQAGTSAVIDGLGTEWGWTPDGHLLAVDGDRVTTCDPTSAECTTAQVDHGRGVVKIAGNDYES